MELNDLKAREEVLNTAIWVGDLEGMKDLELLVLPLSSPLVVRAWARRQRRAPRDAYDDEGRLDEGFEEELDQHIYAETILRGWKNLTQDNEPLPFNEETSLVLIQSSHLFESAVRIAAARATKLVGEKAELIEGNS